MTPDQFRTARQALGLSQQGMALALGMAEGRTVRRWESGEAEIPGPVAILVELAEHNESVRADLVERGFAGT